MVDILNTLYYNIGNFIYLGAQWIISVVLVRMGGFEDAGLFSLAMTYGNLFGIFACYGLRFFQVSDVKNQFRNSTYVVSRTVTIAVSSVSCFLFLILFTDYSLQIDLLIFSYIFYKIVESYADVITGIWQKSGNMLSIGISNTIKGLISLAIFLIFYRLTYNLLLSTFLMSLSVLLVLFLFDFRILRKYENHILLYKNLSKIEIVSLLKTGLNTMIFSLLFTLFISIPRLIIEKEMNAEMLGIFSSLYNPTVIISTLASGMLLSIVPNMTETYLKKDSQNLIKIILCCNTAIVSMGVLATVLTVICGKMVLGFVFGKEIIQYINLFYVLIFVSVLYAAVNCYSTFFIASRKLKPLLIFSILSCIAVTALSFILIRSNGIYGAAYALMSVIVIQFIIETIYIVLTIKNMKAGKNDDSKTKPE